MTPTHTSTPTHDLSPKPGTYSFIFLPSSDRDEPPPGSCHWPSFSFHFPGVRSSLHPPALREVPHGRPPLRPGFLRKSLGRKQRGGCELWGPD